MKKGKRNTEGESSSEKRGDSQAKKVPGGSLLLHSERLGNFRELDFAAGEGLLLLQASVATVLVRLAGHSAMLWFASQRAANINRHSTPWLINKLMRHCERV